MVDNHYFDGILESEVEGIQSTETEADGTEFLNTLLLEVCDDFVQRRAGSVVTVFREPRHYVELPIRGD